MPLLTALFFGWGLITSLNDVLIPHLKAVFSLNYVQAMLVQFCFFGAYFLVSLPAGAAVRRWGYQRGMVIGLVIAAIGCALFYPAATFQTYGWFLGALFVLASGVTLLQVAANPYVTLLGPEEEASRRLTWTQAFNSLGTTVGPLFGAALILTAAESVAADAQAVRVPYLGLAAALLAIAVVLMVVRLPKVGETQRAQTVDTAPPAWRYRHLVLGVVAIFVYVGAEVSIGSFLVSVMSSPDVAGLSGSDAGHMLALYWGGAMVGRFLGAWAMKRISAARLMTGCAVGAVVLLTVAMLAGGHVTMWALLAIGLCNAIMFPTIFSLALERLGSRTEQGSGLLCMAIVGGALVPLVQGALADSHGLMPSFVVPLVCYIYITYYAARGHRVAVIEPATRATAAVRT
ncbi:MFS transporter, FHS family, L-fucose permease [Roseateles sp. YR242]|nr:MFS transporter, FHS family, L-fucose permease [Roseateles sp. YR242]